MKVIHEDFIYIPAPYRDFIRIDSIDKVHVANNRSCSLDNSVQVLLRCGVLYKYSLEYLKYFERITGGHAPLAEAPSDG